MESYYDMITLTLFDDYYSNREEYANLEEFIKSKKIKMKNELNEETTVSYAELGDDSDEDIDTSRKRRRKDNVPSYRDDQDEDEESRK